jgi:DNA mismatch repair ATPase MutS
LRLNREVGNGVQKLIDIYRTKKENDKNKIYMFKGGVFYYFLDDDARYLSDKYNFKLTSFGQSVKCGFPVKSIEKYLFMFNEENIELVKEVESSLNDKIIKILKEVDLNEICPKDAYLILTNLKELLSE